MDSYYGMDPLGEDFGDFWIRAAGGEVEVVRAAHARHVATHAGGGDVGRDWIYDVAVYCTAGVCRA